MAVSIAWTRILLAGAVLAGPLVGFAAAPPAASGDKGAAAPPGIDCHARRGPMPGPGSGGFPGGEHAWDAPPPYLAGLSLTEEEAALKTQLLIRSTRQLTLTESGRGYIAACRRILEEVNEAERAAVGEYTEPRGELIVTAPVVFGRLHVLPVISEFLQAYPDVKVRLALGDRNFNLVEDHVDLALRIGMLPDSGLITTQLGSLRRVACASPKYLSQKGIPSRVQDLAAHDCVSFELFAAGDIWRFQVDGVETVVRIHPRLTVSTAEAAIDAAVAGLGVTCVLSYQIESALRAGYLGLILEPFEPAPMPVSFLYASQGRLPLKLRALLDFAAPRLRARLQRAATTLASARRDVESRPAHS